MPEAVPNEASEPVQISSPHTVSSFEDMPVPFVSEPSFFPNIQVSSSASVPHCESFEVDMSVPIVCVEQEFVRSESSLS